MSGGPASRPAALPGTHASSSPAETEALGALLAARLVPGDVVELRGAMGAGKTTFVRGAARALGVPGRITSPTFVLARRLAGNVPVTHLDLHRLAPVDDAFGGHDVRLESEGTGRSAEGTGRAAGALENEGAAALDEEDAGLLADHLAPDTVAFIEWPEAGADALPPPTWRVRLAHGGGDERRIAIERC